jgi:aromatic ring-cleaving dioxygenase
VQPPASPGPEPLPLDVIASFHAHVYFDGPAEREIALQLRERMSARFPLALGRIHDKLVGPHARPMYQVGFAAATFAAFVPWLMLNRRGLSILIHPNTGAERDDHLEKAMWLGEKLPILNADQLAEKSDRPLGVNAINTHPRQQP